MKIKRREKIQRLFIREKEVKKVMLTSQPMCLLMPHDYCLSSIASSFPEYPKWTQMNAQIDKKRTKHERREKKEKSGDKKE